MEHCLLVGLSYFICSSAKHHIALKLPTQSCVLDLLPLFIAPDEEGRQGGIGAPLAAGKYGPERLIVPALF